MRFSVDEDGNYGIITTENGVDVFVPLTNRTKKLWLYKNGDECVDTTGGWTFNTNNSSSTGILDHVTSDNASNTKTKNIDNIYLKVSVNNADYKTAHASCFIENAIDLTDYKKLYILATGTRNNSVHATIVAQIRSAYPKNGASTGTTITAALPILADNKTYFSLDIASLTGNYWINLFTGTYSASSSEGNKAGITMTLTMYEMWLEK